MESVCRHFRPPPQLYFAVYLLSLSQTDLRQSDGLLPRQPVSIGSDGVRLPTFSTPSSTILCCIFTESLANWLAAVRWTLAPATVSSSGVLRHFGGVSEKKTLSDHVTRNASATRNNEAYGQGNGDSRSAQSFAIIKNTGHGNCFTLAVFTLEQEINYPSETSLCRVTPSLTDTPSPFLLLRGGGGCTQAI